MLGAGPGARAQRAVHHASVRLDEVTLRAALDTLMQRFDISVVYLDEDIDGKRVSAECRECSLEEVLGQILRGTGLAWIRQGNQVILTRQSSPPRMPSATAAGSVLDSLTGQAIAGANVLLENPSVRSQVLRWCPTNEYGFYSLRRVVPGTYRLVVRALGYHPLERTITVEPDNDLRLDLLLQSEEIQMAEVTIEGHRTALTSAEGYARGVYIPAAPTDLTQYMLDGARIYNPSHFGSVLSTFNPDVLTDVDLTLGGLPPRYGGRIGGVLDLSMRDGSRRGLAGSAGAGSLGAQLALEGPLGSQTTFLLSWRRGYPDPLVPFLQSYGTPSPLGTTEIVGRLSHRLSGSQQLAFSAYASRDAYTAAVEDLPWALSNNFHWANQAATLRWYGIASPSLFLSASAAYTGYDFSLEHIFQMLPTPQDGERDLSDFRVRDLSLRADAEHYYDEQHTLRGGVEIIHRRIAGKIQTASTQIAPLSLEGEETWELSVYMQDQWALLPGVSADVGARATTYSGSSVSYSAVDPRFSVLVALNDATHIYGAFTSVHQFVHTYRNSGVFLLYPPTFVYPSSEEVKPTTAMQATLGVETITGKDAYVLSAEAFYRVLRNVHGFLAPSPAEVPSSLDDVARYGSGLGYGLELSVRKRLGDLRGSLSYTLAWAKEAYADVNGGNAIPSPFDRRHELEGTLSWVPAEGWTLGALCVVTANEVSEGVVGQAADNFPIGGVAGAYERALVDVNSDFLPGFQRLEVEVARTFQVEATLWKLAVRFLNAYGLADPYLIELATAPDGSPVWQARLRDLKLFPLFPTLSVSVHF